MNTRRRNILGMMDDALRWTGFPARVADDLADARTGDRKHRPLRWVPFFPIAFACAVFVLCLSWPAPLQGISRGSLVGIFVPFMASIAGMLQGVHMYGPLGKASFEDDEREAMLRKDSSLFALWLLAALNGLGQPVLLILSHWQDWQTVQAVLVAASALMLNATLMVCLPTLHASWHLRQTP